MIKRKIFLLTIALCNLLILNIHNLKAQCHNDDWTALKALYEAAEGDDWRAKANWYIVKAEAPPLDCNLEILQGVSLNNSGRVDSLTVTYNKTTSSLSFRTLPPEIGNLSGLVQLDLSWNSLKGEIPIELTNLRSLKSLDLSWNSFTGGIPPEIGTLDSLIVLDLSTINHLGGTIPIELGNLKSLTSLDLSGCSLTGSIPPELGNLSSLKSLDFYFNRLSGSIPNDLGNLSNLKYFNALRNNLSGNIPPELGNLTKLTYLDLAKNELSGSIPAELSNLSRLKRMSLNNNQLTGDIPNGIGDIDSLTYLFLDDNGLSGSIPNEFKNLSELTELTLHNNELNGQIPPGLSSLIKIKELDLSSNKLTGNIPAEIGNMTNLKKLDLSKNQLSGEIPTEFSNLINLNSLALSDNQLTGVIPDDLDNLTSLLYLELANNQLTGGLPVELRNLKYLDIFRVNNNELSGPVPDLGGTYGLNHFDISSNYFNCSSIENFKFNVNSDYYYGPNWPGPDTDAPTIYYNNYTPQKYKHEAEKFFLVNSEAESITLHAPFTYPGNFTYQWYKNDSLINGANNTILQINNVQLENVGNYFLHVTESECRPDVSEEGITYIAEPIAVRRADLEGCTDSSACNYNQIAIIDDGSCEYLSCDTISNPIKIRTANEKILSETQIKFDLVIDSLGLDYSGQGLSFNLDTRGNYRIESIAVVNPDLLIEEVDVSKLYNNTISINRINTQRLSSLVPVLSATACIINDNIPSENSSCSQFAISGGTKLNNGNFISFDNIYIDIPFGSCFDYDFNEPGNPNEEKKPLPIVLTISAQNCNTNTLGTAEIKILEEGQSPFSYALTRQQGTIVSQTSTTDNNLIEVQGLQAGSYILYVSDANDKQVTIKTNVPFVANVNGGEPCPVDCVEYVTISGINITGSSYYAKKEIDIKGFIGQTHSIEFKICD